MPKSAAPVVASDADAWKQEAEVFDFRGAGVYQKTSTVTAVEATEDGQLPNGLHYRKARDGRPGDLITTNWDGSQGVVGFDLWPKTYAPTDDPTKFRKTALSDATPYWGPPRPFRTLEGVVWMHPRDWVLQAHGGALGDRYPVSYNYMRKTYVVVTLPNETQQRTRQIRMLASICHDVWRAPKRLGALPYYQETLRPARDPEWVMAHGREWADIANTDFDDLPRYWQNENLKSAKIALDAVDSLLALGIAFTPDVVTQVAARVHGAWAGRHRTDRPQADREAFAKIPASEQEKSIAIATWALNMRAPITIESRILFLFGDKNNPGEFGAPVDAGLAPKKLADIQLPDDAIGFRYRDIVRVTPENAEPIVLVTDQSSLFLPGARTLVGPERERASTVLVSLGRRLQDGVEVAQTRVPGIVVPLTWGTSVIDDVYRGVTGPKVPDAGRSL